MRGCKIHIKLLSLISLLFCAQVKSDDCAELIDKYDKKYKLVHLTAAEQRVVFIEENIKIVLLNSGDNLFEEWNLLQVLTDRAVFSCNNNRSVNIVLYKHEDSDGRGPALIDVTHSESVYIGMD